MDRIALERAIRESIATKERLLQSCLPEIEALCERAVTTIRAGGKLMFCGNGGSSCDAAHAAAELVGWFEQKDRPGYPAIALGHEVPTLTAVGNDVGFEHVRDRRPTSHHLLAVWRPARPQVYTPELNPQRPRSNTDPLKDHWTSSLP